jgi:hypothetical protein
MSPVETGLLVTFGFVVLGIFGKAVARGLRVDDLYLGMETGLASIAASAGFAVELTRAVIAANGIPNNAGEQTRLQELWGLNLGFGLVALFCYIFVVTLHRGCENEAAISERVRNLMLIGVANFFGAATLFAFIVYVKGS